ncbi:MAG TPA: ATP-binding protein [Bryobacteraceae bacterium]|nr:ATP-binding protein [Bryobacteraceae bacterium]
MLSRVSIRTRLTLVYTALLFLALVAFAFGAIALLRYRLTARLEASLDQKIQGLEAFLRRETTPEGAAGIPEEAVEYAFTQPEGHLIHVTDMDGNVVLRGDVVTRPALTRVRDFELYGRKYRAFASGSMQPVEESVHELRLLLLWSAPLLLLLIGGSAYLITRQALAPVDRMTQAATAISVHHLEHRLAVPKSRDELSRLASAWNEMLSRLEESVGRMRRFTTDAAHELRTPLTAVRTTAELALRRPRSADEYRQALKQVVAISEQMTRLADDLLSLARADELVQPLNLETLDLRFVIRDVIDEMDPLFAAKAQQIEMVVPEDAAIIRGNYRDIERLLASLVENATKYTPHGGTIAVTLRAVDDAFELDVADSGPGIPEEALALVFDRFYRVDSSRDRMTGGHGLGLAIARQIATAHLGSIQAVPGVNGGACFRVRLARYFER